MYEPCVKTLVIVIELLRQIYLGAFNVRKYD